MTESEGGVETTRISRRKAIKLGALGAAGGAAAWLLPGTAGAGGGLSRARASVPAARVTSAGARSASAESASRAAAPTASCASVRADSRTPGSALRRGSDPIDEGFLKCVDKFDCETGQLCVKRCVDLEAASRSTVSICAWPCNQGPVIDRR